MLLEHFAAGTALRAVQESQAARDWRFSRNFLAQHHLLLDSKVGCGSDTANTRNDRGGVPRKNVKCKVQQPLLNLCM